MFIYINGTANVPTLSFYAPQSNVVIQCNVNDNFVCAIRREREVQYEVGLCQIYVMLTKTKFSFLLLILMLFRESSSNPLRKRVLN